MLGVWRDENTVMTEDVSLFDEVQPAPTGTVTFLFTDIEGSTRLLQQLGRRYGELQAAHQGAIRGACRAWGGYEVDTQGDSFLWAFQAANDAVQAAITAQKKIDDLRLMTDDSTSNHQSSVINPPSSVVSPPSSVTLRVRMSLHTGEPTLVNGRYIGLDLNRGARICAAAHGGQVLLSPTTRDLVEGNLPDGVTLRDMGEHRLKDL
ncbi:MAG: adenylate/guanylate cyclase domain-containing protein, partial [Anaerolineae bacterium]|nr:adenylate/guanylate cyclase domain-containing protein [Anaerolineae bacterium]